MDVYGLGAAYGTAYMGVASAPLGGATLCSSLGLGGIEMTKRTFSDVEPADIPKLIDAFVTFTGFSKADDMRSQLKIMYIDECSQFSVAFLAQVSRRLQIIMDCDLPFGGLKIILAGDFLQKKPPIGDAMFDRLVAVDVRGTFPPSAGSPECEGLMLLRSFKRVDFTRAMRTADPKLLRTLAELRDLKVSNPVQNGSIPPPLQLAEVQRDPNWMFATFGVVSNPERIMFNYEQADKWARFFNVPLVRWPLELTGRYAASLSADEVDLIYAKELGAWVYWVVGAPAMLTENVPRGNKGCVNGAQGVAHSLSWFGSERGVAEEASALVSVTGYQLVTLTSAQRPTTCNVQLTRGESAFEWQSCDSMVDGAAVVPIPVSRHTDELCLTSSECAIAGLPRTVSVKAHPVALAFALTDFKIQGLSLRYLILSLAERVSSPYHEMHGFYVFESRVRTFDGLRRLPCKQAQCAHLTHLAYSSSLKIFYEGWVPERDEALAGMSCWSTEAARAASTVLRGQAAGKQPAAAKRKAAGMTIAVKQKAKLQAGEAMQRPGVAKRLCTAVARAPPPPPLLPQPAGPVSSPSIIPSGMRRTSSAARSTGSAPKSPSIIPPPPPPAFVRPLTAEERGAEERVFSLGQHNVTFRTHEAVVLVKKSLLRLQRIGPVRLTAAQADSHRLDDHIVDALRRLIVEDTGALYPVPFYIVDSLFVTLAMKAVMRDDITSIPRMRFIATGLAPKRCGSAYLISKDLLLFPFYSPGHWSLIVADLRNDSLSLYDSWPGGGTAPQWERTAQHLIRIHAYTVLPELREASERAEARAAEELHNVQLHDVAHEAAALYQRALRFSNEVRWRVAIVAVPKQENGIDCGIFMMAFSICVARDLDVFSFAQEDIPTLRRLFAVSLHERRLIF
jgi:hypothetical protein